MRGVRALVDDGRRGIGVWALSQAISVSSRIRNFTYFITIR